MAVAPSLAPPSPTKKEDEVREEKGRTVATGLQIFMRYRWSSPLQLQQKRRQGRRREGEKGHCWPATASCRNWGRRVGGRAPSSRVAAKHHLACHPYAPPAPTSSLWQGRRREREGKEKSKEGEGSWKLRVGDKKGKGEGWLMDLTGQIRHEKIKTIGDKFQVRTSNVRRTLLHTSWITCNAKLALLCTSRITCNARHALLRTSRITCNPRCALLRVSHITVIWDAL
jgi:hypothetical protein